MRCRLVTSAWLMMTSTLFHTSLWAQSDENSKKAPGIEVGKKAPAFKLKGHDGKEYALADLLKKGKVALVFYRSANW